MGNTIHILHLEGGTLNNVGRTLLLGLPRNKMTILLNVLRFKCLYFHQNVDFSTYKAFGNKTNLVTI